MDDNNFDFLVGTWDCVHRRLVKPLSGSDEWGDEFTARAVCHSFFGGAGSFDEQTFPGNGFSAATVRTLDRKTGLWSIYWINSERPETLREVPVVGRFENCEGLFECDDTYDGKPIRVRYRWFDITLDSARYEQSFSSDGGLTWEVNWTTAFTRIS
jgi:hypothetical protein